MTFTGRRPLQHFRHTPRRHGAPACVHDVIPHQGFRLRIASRLACCSALCSRYDRGSQRAQSTPQLLDGFSKLADAAQVGQAWQSLPELARAVRPSHMYLGRSLCVMAWADCLGVPLHWMTLAPSGLRALASARLRAILRLAGLLAEWQIRPRFRACEAAMAPPDYIPPGRQHRNQQMLVDSSALLTLQSPIWRPGSARSVRSCQVCQVSQSCQPSSRSVRLCQVCQPSSARFESVRQAPKRTRHGQAAERCTDISSAVRLCILELKGVTHRPTKSSGASFAPHRAGGQAFMPEGVATRRPAHRKPTWLKQTRKSTRQTWTRRSRLWALLPHAETNIARTRTE